MDMVLISTTDSTKTVLRRYKSDKRSALASVDEYPQHMGRKQDLSDTLAI
jgi:hypothetical protein